MYVKARAVHLLPPPFHFIFLIIQSYNNKKPYNFIKCQSVNQETNTDVSHFDRTYFFTSRNTVQASLSTRTFHLQRFSFTKNNNFYIFLATYICLYLQRKHFKHPRHTLKKIIFFNICSPDYGMLLF
jgi:hypothetical protein